MLFNRINHFTLILPSESVKSMASQRENSVKQGYRPFSRVTNAYALYTLRNRRF